ncbi:hypothetical protein CDAR_621291 [Caerostris darwini]|uniref:Ribosomal protein L2 n=1 Tax=Caerostris darwini TaxID=1538125 RepID=A0AAV4RMA9_9ARAC|nr:hypothetical protein CDAR_621291 [Caerostris darwini]
MGTGNNYSHDYHAGRVLLSFINRPPRHTGVQNISIERQNCTNRYPANVLRGCDAERGGHPEIGKGQRMRSPSTWKLEGFERGWFSHVRLKKSSDGVVRFIK